MLFEGCGPSGRLAAEAGPGGGGPEFDRCAQLVPSVSPSCCLLEVGPSPFWAFCQTRQVVPKLQKWSLGLILVFWVLKTRKDQNERVDSDPALRECPGQGCSMRPRVLFLRGVLTGASREGPGQRWIVYSHGGVRGAPRVLPLVGGVAPLVQCRVWLDEARGQRQLA